MTASTIITLRETLEASLVVGIVLTYLHSMQQMNLQKFVWRGVVAGVVASIAIGIGITMTLGAFEGRAEEIYEGILMIIAAGLITWMLLWMLDQRRMLRKNIEHKIDSHIQQRNSLGIFLLVFFSVLREGAETVIFLHAAYLQASSAGVQLLGAGLGIAVAILISILFFRGVGHMSMRRCFSITTGILVLFAAGLTAHGVHELQEAGIVPIIIEHAWDTNAYLDENGTIGSIFKGVFGYNGNPSLLEILSYWAYLVGIGYAWKRKI